MSRGLQGMHAVICAALLVLEILIQAFFLDNAGKMPGVSTLHQTLVQCRTAAA